MNTDFSRGRAWKAAPSAPGALRGRGQSVSDGARLANEKLELSTFSLKKLFKATLFRAALIPFLLDLTTKVLANAFKLATSPMSLDSMDGRCILTATVRGPPYLGVSTARCTCATLAAPRGTSSNSLNTSANDSSPCVDKSSLSITFLASDAGMGSRLSVKPLRASVYCDGNKS